MDKDVELEIQRIKHELDKTRVVISQKVGIRPDGSPDGNGILHRLEIIEHKIKDIDTYYHEINRKLDSMVTIPILKKKIVEASALIVAVSTILKFLIDKGLS